MTKTLAHYENRFIAFIDILGFSSIIEQTVNDPALAKKIHSVLSHIADLKKDNESGVLSLKDTGKEVSVFSDSIVSCSTRYDGVGVMLRGGVAFGKLYHRDMLTTLHTMGEMDEHTSG